MSSWTLADVREAGRTLGLLDAEVSEIVDKLGRLPNKTELTVFAGMWSEHCAYKSTKHWLATLPREGARVLAGPGSHAGVVDVGDGWAVAFKVESHNHPSAVEPYQGAATGVGGILRDVIAQGARPCAVMDYLCFGDPCQRRTRHLISGIVGGIAGYGNAFGVPNIGGRTIFDPRYEGNPLVNALAAGLVRPNEMRHGRAEGVGNALLYVGATTGRDGILGAAFASEELGSDTAEERSHVQVGDPFMGKMLMEACLSFGRSEGRLGGQDLGACGLTCATFETAASGGVGMDVDLDAVPLREADMTAHEILLSESQERFFFVVEKGFEERAVAHFEKHGVHTAICGRITGTGRVRVLRKGETVVDLPADLVSGGVPSIHWPLADALPPAKPYPEFSPPSDLGSRLVEIVGLPGIADSEPLWSHYDQTVGNRTVRGPAMADAAVQKLPGSRRGFALVMTGRGEQCDVDPYHGAQAALSEALLRLACAGAEMAAITDGINAGSPRNPVEARRIAEAIRGLGDGLRTLGVPVTGGNVSLYNESPQGAVPPTPVVGALGLVADVSRVPRARLEAGDVVFILGALSDTPSRSLYGRLATGVAEGPAPEVDLGAAQCLARMLVAQVNEGRVRAAKSVGPGGLAVALAELCIRGGSGARLCLPPATRPDWLLFGEPAAVAVVTTTAAQAEAFERAARASVPVVRAGAAAGERLVVEGMLDVRVSALNAAYRTPL